MEYNIDSLNEIRLDNDNLYIDGIEIKGLQELDVSYEIGNMAQVQIRFLASLTETEN